MGVRPHVVIVGAGFGGLAAARGLDKLPVEVTLIDRQNFTTFQPLLYQVATAGLNATDVAHPCAACSTASTTCTCGAARWSASTASRKWCASPTRREVAYDHLILAVGAVATWFGVPSGRERHPLYTLEDAVRLRNHVIERFEVADADPPWWTRASSPSWSWVAARPGSRPPRWPSCSRWCSGRTTRPSPWPGPR